MAGYATSYREWLVMAAVFRRDRDRTGGTLPVMAAPRHVPRRVSETCPTACLGDGRSCSAACLRLCDGPPTRRPALRGRRHSAAAGVQG